MLQPIRLFFLIFAAVWNTQAMGLLVPAYFYPGGNWTKLNEAARRVPLVAIMNPNSGPGNAVNNDYTRAVAELRRVGGRVIGYVHTSYTARALEQVQGDVDKYHSFYEIDGIFVDEMTNDSSAEHVAYYEALYNYIKGKKQGYIVVGNPGINAAVSYITRPAVDTLVTFENNDGYEAYGPDAWTKTQPATATGHLCYATPNAATMTNYVNLAVERNAGYIYVTDDSGGNPWDRLPSYWAEEVGLVEEVNRAAARKRPAVLNAWPADASSIAVNVLGTAGRYVLQVSNNFTNWLPAGTNVSATGTLSFLVETSGTPRFFRTEQ